jgi:hypothetical protein
MCSAGLLGCPTTLKKVKMLHLSKLLLHKHTTPTCLPGAAVARPPPVNQLGTNEQPRGRALHSSANKLVCQQLAAFQYSLIMGMTYRNQYCPTTGADQQ